MRPRQTLLAALGAEPQAIVARDAVLSDDRVYRYSLTRSWSLDRRCVWVMLNPSVADERKNDATIIRCIGFAQRWGCGGIDVVNLFAYRTTYPAFLRGARDPVGPENDRYLMEACTQPGALVVCAWGTHGALLGRSAAVREMLREAGVEPMALQINQDGQPAHPLRLPYDLPLVVVP